MAKKKNSSKDKDTDVEATGPEGTPETSETPEMVDAVDTPEQTEVSAEGPEVADQDADAAADSEPLDEPQDDTPTEDDAPAEEPVEATAEEVEREKPDDSDTTELLPVHPPAPEQVIVRQGGFIPMLLGGVVAAAIGFAVAKYGLTADGADAAALTDLQRKMEGQSGAVSKLTGRVETLEGGVDLSGVETAQDETRAEVAKLSARVAALETLIADLGTRSGGDGPSADAIAAYEQELSTLRSAVDELSASAAQMEENAQAAAQATLQRAALTRIQTALESGSAFEPALADLEGLGVAAPEALRQAAGGGTPTLSDLQESFPDAARAALIASRRVDGAEAAGLGGFLRTQLGARSLEPREGNDPDAVLSRAEAAAREGRLTDALAELDALPPEGQAELADWSARAKARMEAVAAAQELGEKLN